MKSRSKESIYSEVKKAKQERADLIEGLKKKKVEATAEQKERETRAAEALEKGSAEDYAKAKAEGREAADKVEFFSLRLKEAENKPLFTSEEADEKSAEILEAAAATKAEGIAEAVEDLKKASEKLDKALKGLQEANEVLALLAENSGKSARVLSVIETAAACRGVKALQQSYSELNQYWH